jgi:MFS family permease
MTAPMTCPQCAAPTTGAVNCAYCGARVQEAPTAEYLEDLQGFLRSHNQTVAQHYSPWMGVSLLITLGGPVAGYYGGATYDWPWVTAFGVFVVGALCFIIAIGKADARYARKHFIPELRQLMARKGYSTEVVKRTGRAELKATSAEQLLAAIERL